MILDDLVAATKRRLQREKATISADDMKAKATAAPTKDPQAVYDRFNAPGIHLIGEVKKASPTWKLPKIMTGTVSAPFQY